MGDTTNNSENTQLNNIVPAGSIAPVVPVVPNSIAPASMPEAVQPAPAVAPVVQEQVAIQEPVIETVTLQEPVAPAPVQEPVVQEQVVLQEQPVQTEPVAQVVTTPAPETPVVSTEQSIVIQPVVNTEVGSNIIDDKILATITEADLVVVDEGEVETDKVVETNNSDEVQYEVEKENKQLPITVLLMFLGMFVAALIYFFIVMSPEHVFDKAIDNIVDSVTSIVDNAKKTETNATRIVIGTDLTVGLPADADYIDGVAVDGVIDVDLKNLAMAVSLLSSKSETRKVSTTVDQQFDARLYFKDGGLFSSNTELDDAYPGKVAAISNDESLSINFERADLIVEVANRVKNEIENEIKSEQLKRSITTKKIKGQTTIALLAHTSLDHDEVYSIYKNVLERLLKDKEFVNKIVKILNGDKKTDLITAKDVEDSISEIITEPPIEVDSVIVNLYMNLANTQLISLDVTVDNYYFQVDNLNGYFIGLIKYKDDNETFDKPIFQMDFEYDANKGNLDGDGFIMKDDNSMYAKYSYERKEDEEGKKIGNNLSIWFFDKIVKTKKEEDDLNNILCKIDCVLKIYKDDEIKYSKDSQATVEKAKKFDSTYGKSIKILGKDNLVSKMTDTIEEGIEFTLRDSEHILHFILRRLLYNKISVDDYLDKELEETLEKYVNKHEKMSIDEIIEQIEEEKEEATDYCGESVAVNYNNLSRLGDNIDKFVLIKDTSNQSNSNSSKNKTIKQRLEDLKNLDIGDLRSGNTKYKESVFNWACLYEIQDQTFYREIDYDKIRKLLKKIKSK